MVGEEFLSKAGMSGEQTARRIKLESVTSRSPVLEIPAAVARFYFAQLDCHDLIQCSLVCRLWHEQCAELLQGWEEEFQEQRKIIIYGCPD